MNNFVEEIVSMTDRPTYLSFESPLLVKAWVVARLLNIYLDDEN